MNTCHFCSQSWIFHLQLVWISWPGRVCSVQTQDKAHRSKLYSLLFSKMFLDLHMMFGRNILLWQFIGNLFHIPLRCADRSPYRVRQMMVLIKTVSKTKCPLFYIYFPVCFFSRSNNQAVNYLLEKYNYHSSFEFSKL